MLSGAIPVELGFCPYPDSETVTLWNPRLWDVCNPGTSYLGIGLCPLLDCEDSIQDSSFPWDHPEVVPYILVLSYQIRVGNQGKVSL